MTAVLLPVLAGRLVRHHRAQTHQLRELTAELEHERERTAQMAVAEERARIARELHDVVAHWLSVIAIQADGAEAALEKDPELARRPLQAIRRSAEEALGEMRRLLGVLREADAGAGAGAAARAGAAAGAGRARPRGRDAGDAARRGHAAAAAREPRPVGVPDRPGGADERAQARRRLAGQRARRVAARHARPAGARHRHRAAACAVNGDGHGLVGMRERVKLHGGELRTGALPGGGFEVTAKLPLPRAHPPGDPSRLEPSSPLRS